MNCEEVSKFIQVYVDDEFDEDDRRDLEEHLSQCARCRSLAEYESRFRQAVRARIPKPVAPIDFRERLLEKMAGHKQPWLNTRRLVFGTIPAAAALMLVLTFTWTVTSGFSPIVDEAISRHSSVPPVEMNSSDTNEIENWFRAKVAFNVALPRFPARQLDLVGARLSNLAERQAALIRYRQGAHLFSLFVSVDPGDGDLGGSSCRMVHQREVCTAERRGFTVISWRSRGLVYALVGDTTPADLFRLLSSVGLD